MDASNKSLHYLENQFHQEMLGVDERAKKECRYNATRFLQIVAELGGQKTAKRLLAIDQSSEGFTTL